MAKKKICVGKKFLRDNYLQCEDGKDEEDCELQYKEKGIFSREHRHICKSPFLNITRGIESGKFFPMRAIGNCIYIDDHSINDWSSILSVSTIYIDDPI